MELETPNDGAINKSIGLNFADREAHQLNTKDIAGIHPFNNWTNYLSQNYGPKKLNVGNINFDWTLQSQNSVSSVNQNDLDSPDSKLMHGFIMGGDFSYDSAHKLTISNINEDFPYGYDIIVYLAGQRNGNRDLSH